MFFLVHIYLS